MDNFGCFEGENYKILTKKKLPKVLRNRELEEMGRNGIEPSTHGFSVLNSRKWQL
jgi:hypothetical protein